MFKSKEEKLIRKEERKIRRAEKLAKAEAEFAEVKRKHDDKIAKITAEGKIKTDRLSQERRDLLREANRDLIDSIAIAKDAFSEFKSNMKSVKGDFKKISSDMKTMTTFDATRLRYPKMTDDEKSAFETEAHAFLSNRFDLEYADLYLELIHVENDPNSTMDDINPLRKRLKEMRKADVQAHKNSSKD